MSDSSLELLKSARSGGHSLLLLWLYTQFWLDNFSPVHMRRRTNMCISVRSALLEAGGAQKQFQT
jgi:hypothetical protein